jgi:hypothetical protein
MTGGSGGGGGGATATGWTGISGRGGGGAAAGWADFVASSSAIMRRMEARISSIEGSCDRAG